RRRSLRQSCVSHSSPRLQAAAGLLNAPSQAPDMKHRDRQSSLHDAIISRRRFLAQLSALPLAGLAARASLAQQPPITSPASPNSRAFNFAALNQWITPNDEFFVRSHFGTPRLATAPFVMSITGEVER